MEKKPSMRESLMTCYREMIASGVPVDKITVSDLCKQLGISRKTFYAYFEDKQAILEQIFREDIATPISTLMPLFSSEQESIGGLLLLERVYQGIYENRDFYTHVVTQNSDRIFTHIFQNGLMDLSIDLFRSKHGTCSEKYRYVVRFTAAGQAGIVVQWIRDGFKISPRQLAKWVHEWTESTNSAILNPNL